MRDDDWGVDCHNLVRTFGVRQALVGVDLKVRRGSMLALLGTNGAGKTTLLKILATLVLPSSGLARILGLDVVENTMASRRLIGFAPAEERSFHGRLTAIQNLEFFATLQGVSSADFRQRVWSGMEELGLQQHANSRFAELSSGMKQSLALLRSLLHDPPVLLLDEPTRSLSPERARFVMALLTRLAHQEGKTVLLATHNLMEADTGPDEIAVLHRGRITCQGIPAELYKKVGILGPTNVEAIFDYFTNDTEGESAT